MPINSKIRLFEIRWGVKVELDFSNNAPHSLNVIIGPLKYIRCMFRDSREVSESLTIKDYHPMFKSEFMRHLAILTEKVKIEYKL